jgi:hypothetical protein
MTDTMTDTIPLFLTACLAMASAAVPLLPPHTGSQETVRAVAPRAKESKSTLPSHRAASTEYFDIVCGNPSVVRCVGFETPVAHNSYGDPGQDADHDGHGGYTNAGVDSSTAASGKSSFHFSVPEYAPADSSGAVHFNFDPTLTTSFGEGQEFYIQWRQKMDDPYLNNAYLIGSKCPPIDGTPRTTLAACPGDTLNGGMKQFIIAPQDTSSEPTQFGKHWSCEIPHIVITMSYYNQAPMMYHSCSYYEPFAPAYMPPGYSFPKFLSQSAVPCGGPIPPGQAAPDPCVKYVANEWMTFQVHVKVGRWYRISPLTMQGDFNMRRDSQVDMWLARDNQPSVLVQSMVFYSLRNAASDATKNQPGAPYNYGKVWFLPYNTGRDPNSGPYPVANTWYDNVVISRERVPDPAVELQPVTNLSADASKYPTVTLRWVRNHNVAGAYAETEFKVERCPGQIYDCEAAALAGKTWTLIGTVPKGVLTFVDTSCVPGQIYTYRVSATDGTIDSAHSNPATNVPAPPSDLALRRLGADSAQLTWTDNSESEREFAIERCQGIFQYYKANGTAGQSPDASSCLTAPLESGGTQTQPFIEIARVAGAPGSGNVLSYTDTTVLPGLNYTYRVRSVNGAGTLRLWRSRELTYTANVLLDRNAPACDVNEDGRVDILDVQTAVKRIQNGEPCSAISTTACTVEALQTIANAILGSPCSLP